MLRLGSDCKGVLVGWVEYLIVQKLNGAHLEGRDMYILFLELVLALLGKGDVYLHRTGASYPSQKAHSCARSKHLYLWKS